MPMWANVGPSVALVAELVDAQDLKSCLPKGECGFDSRLGHTTPTNVGVFIFLLRPFD